MKKRRDAIPALNIVKHRIDLRIEISLERGQGSLTTSYPGRKNIQEERVKFHVIKRRFGRYYDSCGGFEAIVNHASAAYHLTFPSYRFPMIPYGSPVGKFLPRLCIQPGTSIERSFKRIGDQREEKRGPRNKSRYTGCFVAADAVDYSPHPDNFLKYFLKRVQ